MRPDFKAAFFVPILYRETPVLLFKWGFMGANISLHLQRNVSDQKANDLLNFCNKRNILSTMSSFQ